jgi:hypothetical protein
MMGYHSQLERMQLPPHAVLGALVGSRILQGHPPVGHVGSADPPEPQEVRAVAGLLRDHRQLQVRIGRTSCTATRMPAWVVYAFV